MFPLGSVLFPTMVLPLHVFEPRYRALLQDCLDGEQEFGVVLIERGHEVGGGDQRSGVGTVAQIVDAQRFPDGRWAVATVGTRRIRVAEWLPDDPYPLAVVHEWLDEPPTDIGLGDQREALVTGLRRLLAMQSEAGLPAAPATTDIDLDPTLSSYQISALAPFGTFDKQRLLAAESVQQRFEMLTTMIAETTDDLRAQLDQS